MNVFADCKVKKRKSEKRRVGVCPGAWEFLPCAGGDSPTASGPPSLSGRVFLGALGYVRARWGMSGRVGVPALRRGRLTHRKRSPLPFREGFFGALGYVGVCPGVWGYVRVRGNSCPAPGATHPPQAVPPPFQGGFLGALGWKDFWLLPATCFDRLILADPSRRRSLAEEPL